MAIKDVDAKASTQADGAVLQVAQLARLADVEAHVVRYYTRLGLLHPQRRRQNRYRIFSHTDLARLCFIRQSRELGYSLAEIREILDGAERGPRSCPRVGDIFRRRVGESRQRLSQLQALQTHMEKALRSWIRFPDQSPTGEALLKLVTAVTPPDGQ